MFDPRYTQLPGGRPFQAGLPMGSSPDGEQPDTCAYCGRETAYPEIDHIMPVKRCEAAGIPPEAYNGALNLAWVCKHCNRQKCNQAPAYWIAGNARLVDGAALEILWRLAMFQESVPNRVGIYLAPSRLLRNKQPTKPEYASEAEVDAALAEIEIPF